MAKIIYALRIATVSHSSQVAIGHGCSPLVELCSTWTAHHRKETFKHPDHITFCQNFTFWNSTKKDGKAERLSRDLSFTLAPILTDRVFPCTGNFPGFYTYTNYSFGGNETFGELNTNCVLL